MRLLITIILFILTFFEFSGDHKSHQDDEALVFKVNLHLQPFDDKGDYRKLLNSLNGFLRKIYQNDTNNTCWLQSDFAEIEQPYSDFYTLTISTKFKDPYFYKPTLLEIIRMPVKDQYNIKLAYIGPDTVDLGTMGAIYNVIAVKQYDGYYKFKSALIDNTADWHRTTVGTITYIYRDEFNRDLADKANRFNIDIANKFQVKPISIKYYKFKNAIEMAHIKGYDYVTWMYLDTAGGQIGGDNIIYSANNSEWYPHEFVHFYTPSVYNCPFIRLINEGYATYLGGSGGKPLGEILKITSDFYKKYPERNILADLDEEYRINGSLSVVYPIGGLICKLIDDRLGFESIKELFKEPDLYKAIEGVLGINKNDLHKFLKKELAKYGE